MRRYFGKNPVDFKDERKTSLGKFAHIFKKEQRNVQSFGSVKRSANRKSHVFFEYAYTNLCWVCLCIWPDDKKVQQIKKKLCPGWKMYWILLVCTTYSNDFWSWKIFSQNLNCKKLDRKIILAQFLSHNWFNTDFGTVHMQKSKFDQKLFSPFFFNGKKIMCTYYWNLYYLYT